MYGRGRNSFLCLCCVVDEIAWGCARDKLMSLSAALYQRAGLATVSSSFFGLATNTLNVRNNFPP